MTEEEINNLLRRLRLANKLLREENRAETHNPTRTLKAITRVMLLVGGEEAYISKGSKEKN